MTNSSFKYCPITTKAHSIAVNHPYSHCAIKKIIVDEGGKGRLFNSDEVINLDQIEKTIARTERRNCKSTMDIFLGLSLNQNKKHIALIEFKFNLKNPTKISKTDLEEKVKGSKSLLGQEISIFNKYYIVVNDRIVSQAKSFLHRKFSGKSNNAYEAISENMLYEIFW